MFLTFSELGQRNLNPSDQVKLMEALMGYKLSIKELAQGLCVVCSCSTRYALTLSCLGFAASHSHARFPSHFILPSSQSLPSPPVVRGLWLCAC